MRGAINLGNYKPTSFNTVVIRAEFLRFLDLYGLAPDPDAPIMVLPPGTIRDEDIREWHPDGHDGIYPEAIVVWSNEHSTEIRCEGELYQGKPGDVVLILNRISQHRCPPAGFDCGYRWFTKAWITHIPEGSPFYGRS